MTRQDKLFFATFFLTLSILVFLLRGPITGQVIQTSYCNNEGCYEFCKSDSECSFGDTCCQEEDFGICKTNCDQEFQFKPNVTESPYLEQPLQEKSNNILYFVLILITLSIGGLYFYLRNKTLHIKLQ